MTSRFSSHSYSEYVRASSVRMQQIRIMLRRMMMLQPQRILLSLHHHHPSLLMLLLLPLLLLLLVVVLPQPLRLSSAVCCVVRASVGTGSGSLNVRRHSINRRRSRRGEDEIKLSPCRMTRAMEWRQQHRVKLTVSNRMAGATMTVAVTVRSDQQNGEDDGKRSEYKCHHCLSHLVT